MNWSDTSVLITGGTGSFGNKLSEVLMRDFPPKRLIIFSRDELKQSEMRQRFPDTGGSPLRYFVGDVRDRDRLQRAFKDVDVVVHAAALKQVPACEYNPFEAILTNILGTRNVIDAAIDQGVKKVLAVSTDKAVNPVNLYGATKLCMEKVIVQANYYSGGSGTSLSCSRYGNVVGSRGSVLPLFVEQRKSGRLTITDPRMTRFWLTLEYGVRFVLNCLDMMHGGEVFVPKIPSMRVRDLAKVVAPECKLETIGIRPGEKLHELLISEDEARTTVDLGSMYVIKPAHPWWNAGIWKDGADLPDGFRYGSDTNDHWLAPDDLAKLCA
ncbi:MAG TPA: UDP-N-acetylglucosamine 4,6-dehydratase (inverting) [Candidatus Sulfotelmatobacter sp.]|nr:UDP-N-acetylglucosamine 4,6-dehydratase (inverting) [Candidatus Sulfotelmatobacter sp.]